MLFASPLQRYLTARKDRFIVRSIAKVGEISFGIYLIHMLVNMVLNNYAATTTSISYWF